MGDYEQKQMREEIEALTEEIKICPGSSLDQLNEKRKLQKQRFEKKLELGELLELERVKEVQEEALRSGMVLNLVEPPAAQLEEDAECPLCLSPFEKPKQWDDTPPHVYLSCCNKFVCRSCRDKAEHVLATATSKDEFENLLKNCNFCPFCRSAVPGEGKQHLQLQELADKGIVRA